MPMEVYTGTRPGRPRLLLVVNAALLVAMLGLAWWQVHAARGLGPSRRIGDTPLMVRLPHGWRADPRNPRVFMLPVASRTGRLAREFERRIEFEFTRLPAFQAPEQLLRLPELENLGQVAQVQRARLGKYDAIEVHYVLPMQIGRLRVHGQILARLACLPRGHLIKVVYEPLIDLRPSDEQILDEVCASVRLDDPTLSGAANDYLARAGLTLPLERDWQVVGPDFDAIAGLYIGGSTDQGPAWSIGVLRTWLAAGRTPRDLLSDLAIQQWLNWDVAQLIREPQPAGATKLTTIRHPKFGEANTLLPSAWIAAQSASQAVLLLVYAGPQGAEAADAIAEKLAGAVQFAAPGPFGGLAAAEDSGAKLVADLYKSGPVARWGRESVDTTYRRAERDETVVVRRAAVHRDPTQGYEGSLWRRTSLAREEHQSWTLDGQAATYEWHADLSFGPSLFQISEQRAQATGSVRREILIDERERHRFDFTPGPSFVPPPAEDIIKGWVARREATAAVVEMSSALGAGTHTVWLQALAPDGQYPRVLVQDDYWPVGSIEAYDDARAQTQYELYPGGAYRRVK